MIACRGEKGSFDPSTDPDALAASRAEEVARAAEVLQLASVEHLGYPDGEIENDAALRARLIEIVRRRRPDALVAPDPTAVFFGDSYVNHRDHRQLGWAVLDTLVPAASPLYVPEAGPAHQVGARAALRHARGRRVGGHRRGARHEGRGGRRATRAGSAATRTWWPSCSSTGPPRRAGARASTTPRRSAASASAAELSDARCRRAAPGRPGRRGAAPAGRARTGRAPRAPSAPPRRDRWWAPGACRCGSG